MSEAPIVIIGAGLAGLTCAKELHAHGRADVIILEAAPEPGGRVRSRRTADGFTLDLGFQVLLDSYPAARRQLDFPELRPRYFESGAILADGVERWVVANPLRSLGDIASTVFGSAIPWADAMRLGRLVTSVVATPDDCLLAGTASAEDVSTAGFLVSAGFSRVVVERFFRPFFGGVFLDDALGTSAALFRYYLKKFAVGRALVPARGMGEVTRQLAARLPVGSVRCGATVEQIEVSDGRAVAVQVRGGERIPCRAVVVATDEPSARRLTGDPSPAQPAAGTTVVYFKASAALYGRSMLFLPAGRNRLVRHLVAITNVAPEFAPPGRHLLSATVLDRRGLDDDALIRAVREDVHALFPGAPAAALDLEAVAVIDVPYALIRQGPGFARFATQAPVLTKWRNVWLAGDQVASGSINAAMETGERAAARLLQGPM